MKKVLALLISLGLLSSTIISAAMGPRRTWQCLIASTQNNCSNEEITAARKWIIGVPVTVALASLGAIGIYAGKTQIENLKKQAAQEDYKTLRDEKIKALGQVEALLKVEMDPEKRAALEQKKSELKNMIYTLSKYYMN